MDTQTKATWRAPGLGQPRGLDLRQGTILCHEAGSGPPLVFVHGLLVNANLWRKVVAKLASDFHCVALDLPLGSHTRAMPAGADLSTPALADLVADAIEALGLDDVTLVGNDTGGAVCQLVVTRRPERIGRLVLTPCDYRDNFPPRLFRYLALAARVPGALKAIAAPLRIRAARRLPIAYGWLAKGELDPAAGDSYVLPSAAIPGVEADLRRAISGIDPRHTNAAADRLGGFTRPALIAWAEQDKFFPRAHAEQLLRELPHARLEIVQGSRTFVPEDQPERLAELIAGFVREPVAA
jgi:pimeloyl-ACP methyl ester carboxylesterase